MKGVDLRTGVLDMTRFASAPHRPSWKLVVEQPTSVDPPAQQKRAALHSELAQRPIRPTT
jgi:hypothetical protein